MKKKMKEKNIPLLLQPHMKEVILKIKMEQNILHIVMFLKEMI
jgi:hypothetical protein